MAPRVRSQRVVVVCSVWVGLLLAAGADAGVSPPAVASAERAHEHELASKEEARVEWAKFSESWSALVGSFASQLGTQTAYERARPPARAEFTPRNLFPNASIAVTSMESCVPTGVFLIARYVARVGPPSHCPF